MGELDMTEGKEKTLEKIDAVIRHIEFMKEHDTTQKKYCLNKIIDELTSLKKRIEKEEVQ